MARTAPLLPMLALFFFIDAVPPAAAQLPAEQDRYELRIIRVGTTFQGLRFKTATGDSWQLVVAHYENIPETGPLAPGDSETTLVTDDNDWTAFRIDRKRA